MLTILMAWSKRRTHYKIVTIPYSKNHIRQISAILKSYNVFLQDAVNSLYTSQRKSKQISRGPLYVEIAQNTSTQIFEPVSAPRPLYITPFIYELQSQEEVAIWLGFAMRFDYDDVTSEFVLTSISISLIRGTQSKECLLRAEWDSRGLDADHAQPHWHAISGQSVLNNPTEERWAKIQSHLHLAMCAKWRFNADTGDLKHVHVLDEGDVCSWVDKTLRYIHDQLNYAITMSPNTKSKTNSSFF